MSVDALDLATRIATARDRAAVWRATAAFFAAHGFERGTVGQVGGDGDPVLRDLHTSLPLAYWRRWAAEGWDRIDPAVRHARRSDRPVFRHIGGADPTPLPRPAQAFFEEVRSFHAPGMFIAPAAGAPSGGPRLLAMGARLPHREFLAMTRRDGAALVLAAHLAMDRMAALPGPAGAAIDRDGDAPTPTRDPAPALSPRERDCLALLARGLRNDRIAERLGIAPATVEMHLARARRKLGVRTREAAVARAVFAGLVSP